MRLVEADGLAPDEFAFTAPVAARFSAAFGQALPTLPAQDVVWRLHFSVGVLTHTLLWGHLFPRITNGLCTIEDREALLNRTVQFLAAGFKTPASKQHS